MRRFLLLLAGMLTLGFGSVAAMNGLVQGEPELEGLWQGALKIGATSLRIEFSVQYGDGIVSATMDSPDQGARGIPVSRVSFGDSVVRLEVKAIGGIFEGRMSADGSRLEGLWKQSGRDFPLTLQKEGTAKGKTVEPAATPGAVTARPQEPLEPYPYATIDVEFPNSGAGISLSGTIAVPAGKGLFPAVVLVSGSGAQNRDEEILGHKPFLVIADYLARRGIAVLRYDDRGVGASGGVFATATTYDFTGDASAAVAFLAARPGIDAGRIGIVGHSEGAIIAALAASADPAVSFIVMLAGPGVRGDRLLLMQNAAIAKASGMDVGYIAAANTFNARLYEIAMPGSESCDPRSDMLSALSGIMDPVNAGLIADQLLSPWFRSFLALDPAEPLSSLQVPVLAMNGSKDLQVPAAENLRAIGLALDAAGNRKHVLLEIEGLNHLFQHAETGLPDEYGTIRETFAPEALAAMGDWIASTVR